ncbi:MAG: LEPR-XLL domain-containing protein [Planctomycetes bacterium]|nr:LEPR-XLL domain-containing protein [Planctomycetota bacterium]
MPDDREVIVQRMQAKGDKVLRYIRRWLGTKTGKPEKARPAGAPVFEALESRLLMDANLPEVQPLPTDGQQALGALHLSPALFVENQGQWDDSSVRYLHDGTSVDVAVTDTGLSFQVTGQYPGQEAKATGSVPGVYDAWPGTGTALQVFEFSVSFLGARTVRPVGLQRSGTRFNYYVGDPDNWRAGVPSYKTAAYEELYEGIDLHVRGLRNRVKYEFHVAPGADYRQIAIRYEGIEGLSVAADGALEVNLGAERGVIRDGAPYLYQEIGGQKVAVAGRFVVLDDRTYGFEVTGAIDPDHVLVIDPDLTWSTYLMVMVLRWMPPAST